MSSSWVSIIVSIDASGVLSYQEVSYKGFRRERCVRIREGLRITSVKKLNDDQTVECQLDGHEDGTVVWKFTKGPIASFVIDRLTHWGTAAARV